MWPGDMQSRLCRGWRESAHGSKSGSASSSSSSALRLPEQIFGCSSAL